ncbi:small ribosomal subunit protein uS11 [Anabrus simplex]|uniref:small ribosomal subunit protein uS11 n=1 Tax=Anabrus simplex TaxID=316456 RepID=UPI0035A2EE99
MTSLSLTKNFRLPFRLFYNGVLGLKASRGFHTSVPRSSREDRREMLASMPVKDEGTDGEKSIDVDTLIQREGRVFPDEQTPNLLFNGIPFRELPICNIHVSRNNTIMNITDYKGNVKLHRSCGMEGFKNTRKGTNIAAQATAISFSLRALDHGFKTLRVCVKGLGPGRMSAIKGLQMGGLNIVSVTDNTPVSWNPPRARKQRRL